MTPEEEDRIANAGLFCCGAYMRGTGASVMGGISYGDWKCATCGKEAHGQNMRVTIGPIRPGVWTNA